MLLLQERVIELTSHIKWLSSLNQLIFQSTLIGVIDQLLSIWTVTARKGHWILKFMVQFTFINLENHTHSDFNYQEDNG